MKNLIIGIGIGIAAKILANKSNIGKLEDYFHPNGGRIDRYWDYEGIKIKNFTGKKVDFKKLTSEEVALKFGLAGIEFGNWMSQPDRVTFLSNLVVALEDLAKVLNIPQKSIGANKRLSFAFGARGRSRALAHYERSYYVINLTKAYGMLGVIAHEYGHFIDHLVGSKLRYINKLGTDVLNSNAKIINEYLTLFDNLYYDADGKPTNYNIRQKQRNAYLQKKSEVFARTFEVFVFSKLKEQNDFLQGKPDWTTPPLELVEKSNLNIAKIVNFALD